MLNIIGATSIDGEMLNLTLPSQENKEIDATGLTVFPGLIDPHVHFRTPGMEQKEDWLTAAKAALQGGYTTVFDMPNTLPPTVTATLLQEKKTLIDKQLKEVGIPLRYELYFGADKNHFNEVPKIKDAVIGIKVFMGCSTGNLVIDDDESLHAIFSLAASENLLVAVHAEDEALLKQRKLQFSEKKEYQIHSQIRNEEVAATAVAKAIQLAKIYQTRLYILHVSTSEEISLIKQAKKQGLAVYAETTPHHLFLNDTAYAHLQGKAVVNPPLRDIKHHADLFNAVREGVIDTIGSDHAPHLLSEKALEYGCCPSGMPGIETTLPLLLNAYHAGYISLARIIELTCTRAREIFALPKNDDIVLVDLAKTAAVSAANLKTKCGWSAFAGQVLRGWPVAVILAGRYFALNVAAG